MAEKEERILATKCSGDCLYLRIVGDDCEWASNGTYCAKDLKWKHISEGACAKCKTPKYQGITRQEAIVKMAKALRSNIVETQAQCSCLNMAEAALNALLEEE